MNPLPHSGKVRKLKTALLLSAALAAVPAGMALACHPMATEDTGFVGAGTRQVETGYEYGEDGGGGYSRSLGAVFAYGAADGLDILVTAPWQAWSSGGGAGSGPGDLALEVKARLAEKSGWTFALKPGFSLASGDEEKGLGAGKSAFWAYGVAGRAAGPWQFYLNAGYLRNNNKGGERADIVKASLAAGREAAHGVLIVADLAAESSADRNSGSVPLSSILALVWSLNRDLDLDAGVKLGLNGAADRLGLLAGLTFRF